MSAAPDRSPFAQRAANALNLAVFLAALVTIAIVMNYFAHRPGLRTTVDATKTRAYSLSEQTRALLTDLEGDWTIALIMVEDESDAAVRAQVHEVMDRYAAAAPNIDVITIDPTQPESIGDYERLLAQLRELEADTIEAYEVALREGERTFDELRLFAEQQASQVARLLEHLDANAPVREEAQQVVTVLTLLANEGQGVLDAVHAALRLTETRPIPDYETARSVLAGALTRSGDELDAIAQHLDGWAAPGSDSVAARFGRGAREGFAEQAMALVGAADPLLRLPPLEVASIGAQLESGEAAIVLGPNGAAVIPSPQLFPKLNLRAVSSGDVGFDRRFRGEQVISGAMRSLLVDALPLVVFMHAEDTTLLRASDRNADLVGVASLLAASRFAIEEWPVGRAERPSVPSDRPVVWVVVPPTKRAGLEPDDAEVALVDAARALIDEGEPVLLNVNPSLLPRYRRADPWAALATPFGLRPDTSVALFEAVPVGEDRMAAQPGHTVDEFSRDHPIGRAAYGQQAYLVLPVPVNAHAERPSGVLHSVVVEARTDGRRWLEADWAQRMTGGDALDRGPGIDAPVPLVVAAARRFEGSEQRFVLVGSGGWLFSYVADVYTGIGGDRVALTNPGNQERFLAAVTWLAGMDDLIAPSPVGRQVARLDGIDSGATWRWGLGAIVGLPCACLALGLLTWMSRRIG